MSNYNQNNYNPQDHPQDHPQGQQWSHYPNQPQAAKKKPGCLKIAGIGFAGLLAMIGLSTCIGSGNDNASPSTTSTYNSSTSTYSSPETTEPASDPTTQAPAEPAMEVTAQQMIDDLEGNALKAKTTYQGKTVRVTGYVDNIDASGKYFSVVGSPGDFVLTGVRASIKPEHTAQVAEFGTDEKVTFTGKVSGVGEIMGYSIEVDTIGSNA